MFVHHIVIHVERRRHLGFTMNINLCKLVPPVVFSRLARTLITADLIRSRILHSANYTHHGSNPDLYCIVIIQSCISFQIGGLDVTTSRNFFGRQICSFEGNVTLEDESLLKITPKGSPEDNNSVHSSCHGVFIRAPAVVSVDSPKVKVLATVKVDHEQKPVVVGVEQGNLIATAFHPELTEDPRWHAHFLKRVLQVKCV